MFLLQLTRNNNGTSLSNVLTLLTLEFKNKRKFSLKKFLLKSNTYKSGREMVSGYQRDEKMLLNMNNSLTFKKRSARIDWRKIGKQVSFKNRNLIKNIFFFNFKKNLIYSGR